MSVLSIRIKDNKRKLLKIISAFEDKTIGSLIELWIDDYIEQNKEKYAQTLTDQELQGVMKISEPSFSEWENDEDEVYNDL